MDRMSEVIMSPVELIIAAAVVVFFAISVIWQIIRMIRNNGSDKISVKAVLMSKYEEDYMTKQVYVGSDAVQSAEEAFTEKNRRYLLDFQKADQSTLSFEVEHSVYSLLEEGTEGILVYREDQFISFDSIKADHKI